MTLRVRSCTETQKTLTASSITNVEGFSISTVMQKKTPLASDFISHRHSSQRWSCKQRYMLKKFYLLLNIQASNNTSTQSHSYGENKSASLAEVGGVTKFIMKIIFHVSNLKSPLPRNTQIKRRKRLYYF